MKGIMGEGKVAICAHRGFTKNAPENSLESITAAIDAGFEAVEIDARETKDGVLVLMHDPTVDRTTVGHGPVSDFTLEEIQKLAFRRGGSFHLPTLDRVLAEAAGRIVAYIDMKSDRVDLIVDQVQKHDAYDWVILHDENGDKISEAKKIEPRVNVHSIVNSREELDSLLKRVTPVMVEVSTIPDREFIDYIHSKGIYLELDTMGQPDFRGAKLGLRGGWKRYLSSGADFVMSNYPDGLAALLRGKAAKVE